jgi:hypothetical protein
MNCFQHPQTPAVGVCKHCARGLCPECAVDEGFGLACKDRCEAEVKAVTQIIERSKKMYGKTSAVYIRGAFLYGLMGLFFLAFPFIFHDTPVELHYLFTGMGILFLFGAVLNAVNASRIKKA